MRQLYNEQLKELHENLIQMGNYCEEAICAAASSLMNSSSKDIQRAYNADEHIDALERKIEDLGLRLILKQQPVAQDLRTISAALKMISDMERIGDQAADIAELAISLAANKPKGKELLSKMAKETVQMVNESISAFVENNLEKAIKVIEQDEIVDNLFEQIRIELPHIMAQGEKEAKIGVDLLMAGKYLERIGDHAVNIAEWVEYSITGIHKNHEHNQWK